MENVAADGILTECFTLLFTVNHVLWQMMKENPNLNHVCLCLDNDEAGQSAARRISEKLNAHGISNEVLIPTHKDWNEDILHSREGLCPTLQF